MKDWKEKAELYEEALQDIEELIFTEQRIPVQIRDQIQKIIILKAGVTPSRRKRK